MRRKFKDYSITLLNNFWNNPAYAGGEKRHSIYINYQNYKPLSDFSSATYLIAYDTEMGKKKRTGFGVNFLESKYIVEKQFSLNLSFSRLYQDYTDIRK